MATKDDKFSLNISLDYQEDSEIIQYFKQGGKRVDLLRAVMKFYFDHERGFSEMQVAELNRLIQKALENVMLSISTPQIVIYSDSQTTNLQKTHLTNPINHPPIQEPQNIERIKNIADENGIDFI